MNRSTKHELVYDTKGVVITHVVVSYNRSIQQGHCRSRHYLPNCEFIHGIVPLIRKYPDLRHSVWGDEPCPPNEEWWQCPWGVPKIDTHEYPEAFNMTEERPVRREIEESSDWSSDSEGDYSLSSANRGESAHEDYEDIGSMSDSAEENEALDDGRSIVTEETADVWYTEGYEDDVTAFGMLENAWNREPEGCRKEALYYQLRDFEVEYAVKHHIYAHLLQGNETEVGFAKNKTRSRMRTRLTEKRCIGVPKKDNGALRTNRENNRRRWKKVRIDPDTDQAVSWAAFKRKHSELNERQAQDAFKKLKRRKKEATTRTYNGEVFTWLECVRRWSFYWEMAQLYVWFSQLKKVN